MQDRVPLYPGRVTLTPVSGQANTFDLLRADQPTQEGTPLNKASLLKDATAALYGLGTDAVPDDALHLLSRFQSGLGNEYIWAKSQYQEIKTASSLNFQGRESYEILCANQITIDSSGNISLSNPETYTFTQIHDNSLILKGKYVFYHPDSSHGDDKIKYIDETAQINFSWGSTVTILVPSGGYIVSSQLELVSYVNSPSPDAYPPAVSDGNTYMPLGQLGDKVRIATGSYTGTGTYGENNPNRLTFDFVPRFFTVGSLETISDGSGYVHSVGRGYIMLIINGGLALGYNLSSNYCKLDGNTISWYAYDNADDQFNSSGKKFGYIAIG